MKKILSISFLFCYLVPLAQVKILGKAPAYANKEISLVKTEDYISGKGVNILTTQISKSGAFEFNVHTEKSYKYKLVTNNTEAIIYVDPGATYSIEFPAVDDKSKNDPIRYVSVLFDTLLTYDVNNLILDFNSRADEFIYYNYNILGSELFASRLDTFKLYLSKVYKTVSHSYFSNYVAYSVAEMEMLGPPKKDQAIHELYVYSNYLYKQEVGYEHDKYMEFFNKFYGSFLKEINPTMEAKMMNAINFYASPILLDRVFVKDQLLGDPRIRELVMIKSLMEEYYSREFLSEQILVMLDSISRFSKYAEHKPIALNVINQLTWMQAGYTAPDIILLDQIDSTWHLSKRNGKHIYIGFWSVENTHSVNELELLYQIYKKYKEDIEMVLINVDANTKSWKDFLKKHPEYKWINLHADKRVLKDYKVSSLPIYYLVDPNGKMIQSPAYTPTANGTFKSIDEVFFNIDKKLHPKKGSRVGQKDN